MSFQIRYKPLCTVNLLHGYHLGEGDEAFDDDSPSEKKSKLRKYAKSDYRLLDELKVLVPADTQRRLSGLDCIVKVTKTGFVIATQIADPSANHEEHEAVIPARKPGGVLKLVFALSVREPSFWNYSNIDMNPDVLGRSAYFFSNRVGERGGEFPNLTMPLRPYEENTHYQAGDLVGTQSNGDAPSKKGFLCFRAGDAAPTGADNDIWKKLPNRNYVSNEDKIYVVPSVFSYSLNASSRLERAILIAESGAEHELSLGDVADQNTNETPRQLSIDASKFPFGRYHLQLNGVDTESGPFDKNLTVYINDELARNNPFAVIELIHAPDEDSEPNEDLDKYLLYGKEAENIVLKQPDFVIRILNRHTYWRFHFPQVPDENNLGDLVKDGNQYITNRVMPLTRGFHEVNFGEDGTLLPNPSADAIVPEKLGNDQVMAENINLIERVYSDIYLHIQPK